MPLLILGGPILVGFVLGYFLALPVLITITLICAALVVYLFWGWKRQEIMQIYTLSTVLVIAIGNGSMWITYYFASHQHWVGDFFQRYIFR